MSIFIANQIIKQARISLADGQAKYNAYFVNTKLYEAYRAETNTILETEGYAEVISTL